MAEKRENEGCSQTPPAKRLSFEVISNDSSDRRQEIFYNITADTQFRMSDGGLIRFNRGMLYNNCNSEVIFQMLFGPLREEVTVIEDIEFLTFKLFLDCVMGFMPYSFIVAYNIFPVAWKYQAEASIDDCINALVSEEILDTDKICDVFNMSVMYGCDELANKIFDFISKNYGIRKFFEKRHYCFLLEPRTLVEILKHIAVDSFVIDLLQDWGENYLQRSDEIESVKALFDHYGVTDSIKIEHFESASSLFKFSLSDLGKSLFSVNQILSHLNDSADLGFCKTEWKEIKEGDTITEEIPVQLILGTTARFSYGVETNYCYFYDLALVRREEQYVQIRVQLPDMEDFIPGGGFRSPNNVHPFYTSFASNAFFYCRRPRANLESNFTVKIEYTFHFDCRVLLTNKALNDSNDKLCFTKRIYHSRLYTM